MPKTISFGFKNIPDWDRYTSVNRAMWQANNPGKDIYKEDEIVKRINKKFRDEGRHISLEEIDEITKEVYSS